MSTVPIDVIHNHLADPGEHQSLLLVRYGTLTIEIKRHLAAWSVVAVRAKGNRYPVTERAMDAATPM